MKSISEQVIHVGSRGFHGNKAATIYCLPTMCQELCQVLINIPNPGDRRGKSDLLDPLYRSGNRLTEISDSSEKLAFKIQVCLNPGLSAFPHCSILL